MVLMKILLNVALIIVIRLIQKVYAHHLNNVLNHKLILQLNFIVMVVKSMGIIKKVQIVMIGLMKNLLSVVMEIMLHMTLKHVQKLYNVKHQTIIFLMNFIVMEVNFI